MFVNNLLYKANDLSVMYISGEGVKVNLNNEYESYLLLVCIVVNHSCVKTFLTRCLNAAQINVSTLPISWKIQAYPNPKFSFSSKRPFIIDPRIYAAWIGPKNVHKTDGRPIDSHIICNLFY